MSFGYHLPLFVLQVVSFIVIYLPLYFTVDEIDELVQYAHNKYKKVYVTCNIVFHDEDFKGFEDYLIKLDDIGVDALIVSSFAALKIIKKVIPHMPVHLSTQQSIINSDACNMMQIYGADRVILGRESIYSGKSYHGI